MDRRGPHASAAVSRRSPISDRVTFTNASATINGVSGPINDSAWQSQAINIGSGSGTLDTTSVLTASGTSFVESYDSTAGAAVVSGGKDAATLHPGGAASGTSQSGKTSGCDGRRQPGMERRFSHLRLPYADSSGQAIDPGVLDRVFVRLRSQPANVRASGVLDPTRTR